MEEALAFIQEEMMLACLQLWHGRWSEMIRSKRCILEAEPRGIADGLNKGMKS